MVRRGFTRVAGKSRLNSHVDAVDALIITDLDLYSELTAQALELVEEWVQTEWSDALLIAPASVGLQQRLHLNAVAVRRNR
jgi:hypothetical protein